MQQPLLLHLTEHLADDDGPVQSHSHFGMSAAIGDLFLFAGTADLLKYFGRQRTGAGLFRKKHRGKEPARTAAHAINIIGIHMHGIIADLIGDKRHRIGFR